MANTGLSQGTTLFGLNNITLLDYVSKKPLKTLKIPAELSVPLIMGIEKLFGGSNKFLIEAEPTYQQGEMAAKFKQFYAELFTYMSAAVTTTTTTESTTGAVTTLTNRQGTSVMNSTTGIASVSLVTADVANLRAGFYTVVAMSASTVNVYCATDIDFNEGTAQTFVDDTMLINASPLSITTGGADTPVTAFGVQFVGGSGTIALTTGDTATFEVRPTNVRNDVIIMGEQNIVYNKFSIVAVAQKKGSKETFLMYAPKVQPVGFDVPFAEYKFAENAPKLILLQSTSENMVCKFTRIQRQAT